MLAFSVSTATSPGDPFDNFFDSWNKRRRATTPPAGEHKARIVESSRNDTSAGGTPGGKVTFELTDPPYQGQRVRKHYWITERAIPHSKRMLDQIGVSTFEELDEFAKSGSLFEVEIVYPDSPNLPPQIGNVRRCGEDSGNGIRPDQSPLGDAKGATPQTEMGNPRGMESNRFPPRNLPDDSSQADLN